MKFGTLEFLTLFSTNQYITHELKITDPTDWTKFNTQRFSWSFIVKLGDVKIPQIFGLVT